MLNFEWDPAKAASNHEKHGVSFEEAATAFGDPLSLTIYDPDHSAGEDRYVLLGLSENHRLLVISHAERDDRIRIISARAADKSERRNYEIGG